MTPLTDPASVPADRLSAATGTFTMAARQLECAYQALEKTLARTRTEDFTQTVAHGPGDTPRVTGTEAPAAVVVLNEHGRVLLAVEGTERRKVAEVLSRHQRLAALGEMAAALAHQIRTPLAAALLYASNAARVDLPAGRREELLGKAIGCLRDLEQLIADMLQFARGTRFVTCDFPLKELLDAVEMSLRPVLGPMQRVLITRPGSVVTVHGNREALAGALLNLATNALQAAGETAQVNIRTQVSGRQVEIIVADNGPGVPPELRERIFEPFFTSRPDGTGLGLAVARSVARAHQGEVVLADGSARGATFVLRLPAGGAATSDESQRNPTP